MEDYIHRNEHEEFVRRMEDEHDRQNQRIKALEKVVQQINSLSVSIEKMASNMQRMFDEQQAQGKRLQTLEARDGEKWRSFVGYVIVAVIGGILGFVFKSIGM